MSQMGQELSNVLRRYRSDMTSSAVNTTAILVQ
jgi:hypothetical protein